MRCYRCSKNKKDGEKATYQEFGDFVLENKKFRPLRIITLKHIWICKECIKETNDNYKLNKAYFSPKTKEVSK